MRPELRIGIDYRSCTGSGRLVGSGRVTVFYTDRWVGSSLVRLFANMTYFGKLFVLITAGRIASGLTIIFVINNEAGLVRLSMGRVRAGQENGPMRNSGRYWHAVSISLIPEI